MPLPDSPEQEDRLLRHPAGAAELRTRGSNIGLLATNRNLGSDNAGSLGLDTTIYFTETLSFNGQIFEVHGPTADGGFAWFMRPSYDTSTTHFHVRWGHFAPGIRNDFNVLGFLQDDDRKEFDTNFGHTFFFDEGCSRGCGPSVNFNRYTSFDQGVLRRLCAGADGDSRCFAIVSNSRSTTATSTGCSKRATTTIRRSSPGAGTAATGARSPPISAPGVNFDNDLLLYGGRGALGLRR